MEERIPLLKRLDTLIFTKIDEFRKTPGYSKLLETYAGLEDDQQKIAKLLMVVSTALIPLLLLGVMWWQNSSVEADLQKRISLVERMQKIIADNGEIGGLSSSVASPTALITDSDLTNRMSSALSSAGIDLSKMRVSNFTSDSVTPTLSRAEADFRFEGLTTDQLVGVFTTLLQRERFRISAVQIARNAESNLLDGTFHGVHFGEVQAQDEE